MYQIDGQTTYSIRAYTGKGQLGISKTQVIAIGRISLDRHAVTWRLFTCVARMESNGACLAYVLTKITPPQKKMQFF